MKTLRNKSSATAEQRTGAETLRVLLADEMPSEQPEPIEETKKHIILYLREGLRGVERNWTKYPNNMHGVMRDHLDKSSDGILYVYMWWRSWGFGRNFCRISQKQAVDETVIDSIRTVKRSLDTLAEKCFIVKAMTEDEEIDTTKQGTLYRVMTPKEIDDQVTEEEIPFSDIPIEGIFMPSIPPDKINGAKMSLVGQKDGKHSNSNGLANGRKIARGNSDRGNSGRGAPDKNNPDKIDRVVVNTDNNSRNDNTRKFDRAKNGTPFKEDSLKDSLSPRAIISGFYNKIGQTKTSKEKRERAEIDFKELQKDGFGPEDIQFAIEWTVENAKEDLYDFSIIKHTLGQALAAKKKMETEKVRQLEEEKKALINQKEEQKQVEEQKKIEALKGALDPEDRAELRQMALKEIKSMEGIRETFISDILISAKENEILRSKIAGGES